MGRQGVAVVVLFTVLWFVAILAWVGLRRWRSDATSTRALLVALAIIGTPLVVVGLIAAAAIAQPDGGSRDGLIAVAVALVVFLAVAPTVLRVVHAVVRATRGR